MTYNPFDWKYQYGRDEIDYDTWFSDQSKALAKDHTVDELRQMLGEASDDADRLSRANLEARNRATDRAQQTYNAVAAEGQRALAVRGALRIHELFPDRLT